MSSKKTPTHDDPLKTKKIFISALKDGLEESWWSFYDKYAPLILGFARSRGCSPDQAEDILQETVLALYRCMSTFDYNRDRGKFRSLIFRIALSKIGDIFRKSRKRANIRQNIELQQDGGLHIDEVKWRKEWDKAWEENIMLEAMQQVRNKVHPRTFISFENVFMKGKSVKDTAKEMNIPANTVSQHKHKVLKMITETAKDLRDSYGE